MRAQNRHRRLAGVALAALTLLCTACAGQQVGTVAGNVVGGTAWVAMKGGSLAWKGGAFAVKTTGRTVKGAVNGVNQEFSQPAAAKTAQSSSKASPQKVAALSE